MQEERDRLQVKIDEARKKLPEITRQAIDAVDVKEVIWEIHKENKYDLTQLGDLELETTLLLCGLIEPDDYPKDIQERLGISENEAGDLVKLMNEKVFKKIRNKLIENTKQKPDSREKAPAVPASEISNQELKKAGIEVMPSASPVPSNEVKPETREEILKRLEQPEIAAPAGGSHPILAEKLSGPMQIPSSATVHSLDNLTKPAATPAATSTKAPAPQKYDVDPYRELPE
ncbi:MAG: hypothetical protein WCT29_02865 [Candidatus Paceibacterota bacterium]|jgi:hypothetical protein